MVTIRPLPPTRGEASKLCAHDTHDRARARMYYRRPEERLLTLVRMMPTAMLGNIAPPAYQRRDSHDACRCCWWWWCWCVLLLVLGFSVRFAVNSQWCPPPRFTNTMTGHGPWAAAHGLYVASPNTITTPWNLYNCKVPLLPRVRLLQSGDYIDE